MKNVIFFILIFAPALAFAQIQGDGEVYLTQQRIDAKFRGGGMEKFTEYVNKEFDYKKVTKPGKMVASFTVDTDGVVKNIRLVELIDTESAKEMIRVLNACPAWQPATRGGKPISIDIKYPMAFRPKKS